MKVTKEHMEALRAVIEPLDTEETRERYRRGDYPRAHLTRNLDRRYRWDLFYTGKGWQVLSGADYADSHIDTALARIVPTLDPLDPFD